ncbi:putative DNA helicase [Ralstonia phage RSB3]|uniref:Putative DNA helicase n=1 Tax=Ralstonia phage RSB3 TaxID=1402875 RepID=U3TK70_9CAUD|nr:putative DNA helicase [Ralstonia phage RSB3]BAN92328.1 putative DNA helicase [Ralstonia phage RSB3]
MSDNLILHALRDRRRFNTLRAAVPDDMLSPDTTNMLAWFNLYFHTYPEAERIDVPELQALIKLRADPNAGPEAIGVVQHLAGELLHEPPLDAIAGISNTLRERDLSGRAGALIAAYQRGEEVDLAYELKALALDAKREMQAGGVSQWADGDILDYLRDDADEGGLLLDAFGDILTRSIKGLRPGHNVAVVAPTDKGKTSLLCRLAASWARQRREAFLTDGRPILYLVNEGQAERITTRMWQTSLNCSREQMYAWGNDGSINSRYEKVIGRRDAIRMKNIHGKNVSQVEQIIEHHNPYVVITDMTGRIRSVSNRGGAANDIGQLEEVWNGMRELAAIHNFLHVGTIQVSAEGFDMLYPPLSAMQNSKTGIQTTLDLCLMMGALTNMPNVRGISTPKNKLSRAGMKGENQFQTVFDPQLNVWEMPSA